MSIFRKSSWPFAPLSPLCGAGAPELLAAGSAGFDPRCLLPSPARGLETAARGTNIPVFAAGRAMGRADVEPPAAPSPATNWRVFPLKTMASGLRRSFPASYQSQSDVVSKYGVALGEHKHTAAFSSSTSASFRSWKTSTRLMRACFSRACWSRPSCVPAGRFRTRTERPRTSAR